MIKVLIADDHIIFREGLKELLASEPSIEVVGMASDGGEALSKIGSLKPDLVLLDISMPVMDGFAVAEHALKTGANVKILLLSMHKTAAAIKKALDLKVDGYVLKEEAFDTLLDAIKAIMGGEKYYSSAARQTLSLGVDADADPLTQREKEVVGLFARGLSTKEVAQTLGISIKTADNHRQRVMEKLGFHKITEVVRYALENGLTNDAK